MLVPQAEWITTICHSHPLPASEFPPVISALWPVLSESHPSHAAHPAPASTSQLPGAHRQLAQQRGPAWRCFLAAQIQAVALFAPALVQLCCCTLHYTLYTTKDPGRTKNKELQRWPCAIPQDIHVKVAFAAHHPLYGEWWTFLVIFWNE